MKEGHISTHFDRELEELKDNLIKILRAESKV